jgi:hypothetical protein
MLTVETEIRGAPPFAWLPLILRSLFGIAAARSPTRPSPRFSQSPRTLPGDKVPFPDFFNFVVSARSAGRRSS